MSKTFTTPTKGNATDIPNNANSWYLTIRNAYRGAKQDGQDRYVGTTYTSYFIIGEPELAYQSGVQFRVTSTGEVFRQDQS